MFNKSFKKSFNILNKAVKPLKSNVSDDLNGTIWKYSKLESASHLQSLSDPNFAA